MNERAVLSLEIREVAVNSKSFEEVAEISLGKTIAEGLGMHAFVSLSTIVDSNAAVLKRIQCHCHRYE